MTQLNEQSQTFKLKKASEQERRQVEKKLTRVKTAETIRVMVLALVVFIVTLLFFIL